MTKEKALSITEDLFTDLFALEEHDKVEEIIKALEQEPKIKVLDRDEVIRRLATVDIYQARAWATLIKDLEYLGLKICEVEE